MKSARADTPRPTGGRQPTAVLGRRPGGSGRLTSCALSVSTAIRTGSR